MKFRRAYAAFVTLFITVLLGTALSSQASAISEIAATSAQNNVSPTLTIPVPSGAVSGGILIASLDVEKSPIINVPGGWTLVRSDTNPGALHMVQADYVHVVTGSEPSTYTWTFSAAHGASGGIIAYSGVNTANPIDSTSGVTTTTLATKITTPSVNVSSPNSMLVSITGVGVTRTLTPPASMTSRYINGTTVDGERTTIIAADQALSAAGATGTRTTTFDSTATGVGQLIALRPAPAVDTTAPSTPAGITQTSNTASSVAISWGPSLDNIGVTGYTVYQNNLPVTTTTSTSYNFTGLACGTSYPLAVDAFDAAGNHSAQASINGSTTVCPDVTPPSVPTGLVQLANNDTSVTVGWNASTDNFGVTGYTLYQNGGAITTITQTSYTVLGLACGNTYNLAVDALDAAGNHSTQASLSATTANCANPVPVVSVTAPIDGAAVSGSSVTIAANATDPSGIASVQFMLDGSPFGNPVTTSPYTVAWDTTAFSDGQHTLTASATNNNGSSATSSPVTVTVVNSSPVVDSVTINQAAPMTNDSLTASVTAHDPGGHSLTYSYQWLKNGANISGANGPTLDLSQAGNGNKGDVISLEVTANNGTLTSQTLTTSNPVTIVNTPPSATVNLSNTTPDTDATITATAIASDPDADPISLTYVWSANGTVVKTTVTTSLSDSLDLSLAGNGNYGDSLKVQVTPNDGTANGSTVQATGTVTKPATGTILEYTIGGVGLPSGITSGPDGNLWFSVEFGSSVGRIAPNGTVTLFALPQPGNLGGINPGPDGNIWFTEFTNNKISKINPNTFVITRYSMPTNSGVGGIVAGSDGNMWFLESTPNKIGRITTSGVITLFTVPTVGSFPHGLNLGPDGNIWFNEMNTSKIGKITPSGTITEYKTPTAAARPYVIVAGPDGNMWFTELIGKIGRITTSGVITEFKLPIASAQPAGISSGPDGNVWFTEKTSNKIGRITTSGVITEFSIPTAASLPDKIVSGPDGNLWFTEQNSGKIGRITP